MPVKTRLAILFGLALLWGCGASQSIRRGDSPDSGRRGAEILKAARDQIGKPYRFGGSSPSGFDCSGLAWWSHQKAGIDIPRTSAAQFGGGRKVSRDSLRPGDLVFFTTYKKGPSHVGTYDGKGGFVHAPSSGKKVSIASMSNLYWQKRYLGARRYW